MTNNIRFMVPRGPVAGRLVTRFPDAPDRITVNREGTVVTAVTAEDPDVEDVLTFSIRTTRIPSTPRRRSGTISPDGPT